MIHSKIIFHLEQQNITFTNTTIKKNIISVYNISKFLLGYTATLDNTGYKIYT